ncbi:MAG: Outer membrane protein (OmpH-like) [Firmicutes bacterium ADurb.Bin506]|jgi:Skp family chaperone for outer membrane proteins|nr:MAG: Outer membrane protein (OmpH-like) [Firmicutes bacterium ADurb.Bin506]
MLRKLPKAILTLFICSLLVGIGLGISNLAVLNAAGEPVVIGKLSGSRLGQEFPAMKTAWENIAKQKATLEKELNSKATGQDEEAQAALLEQYNKKYNDYAKTQLDPAQKALEAAIAAVAKEKGVTVVIDDSVVHLGGIDMTDAVLKKGGVK